jgi:predicted secreted protein
MGPITYISVYLVIWWTILFAVLPLGVTSHAEAGIDRGDGGDPGAPVDPKLKRKFITTTIVATILWAIVMVCLQFHLIPLPDVPMA